MGGECRTATCCATARGVQGPARAFARTIMWAATALVETEKHYRRIMGYEHLWVLKAFLDESGEQKEIAKQRRAG